MYYGFVRVAAASPIVRVADCRFNAGEIVRFARLASEGRAQVVCFPELCITGYTCGDLFFQHYLQQESLAALAQIREQTQALTAAIIVGMPLRIGSRLYNTALVLQGGRILGAVPKTNMPNNNEFYEKRWFASARSAAGVTAIDIAGESVPFGTDLLFTDGGFNFAIEICEDIWMPIPPSARHAIQGAEVIFNLSASSEMVAKSAYRHQMAAVHSRRCMAGYVYVSCGAGESADDVVFGGDVFIAENGHVLFEQQRFCLEPQMLWGEIDIDVLRFERSKNTNFENEKPPLPYRIIRLDAQNVEFALERAVDPLPFVPSNQAQLAANCSEAFAIQTAGLAQRWRHVGARRLVAGVSGGLDSALALLACVRAADLLGYDRRRILALAMSGFGTTSRTRANAERLALGQGVEFREIDIKAACLRHFEDIGHNADVHNVVFENAQARERAQILMDIANAEDGMVIGTSDMSEIALGWATYGGDLAAMYGVNAGIPKTLIPRLLACLALPMPPEQRAILEDIAATPISPELLPADSAGRIVQKTEDIIGPYELHDFFLFYMVRFGIAPRKLLFLARQAFGGKYGGDEIEKWLGVFLRRFFAQRYKCSCLPHSPKIGTVNLAREFHMPSDGQGFSTN